MYYYANIYVKREITFYSRCWGQEEQSGRPGNAEELLLFHMVHWNSIIGSPETFTQIPWNRSGGSLRSHFPVRNTRSWQAGAPLEGLTRHQSEQGSWACHDVPINRSTCTEDDSHAIITSPKAKRTKPAILFSILHSVA